MKKLSKIHEMLFISMLKIIPLHFHCGFFTLHSVIENLLRLIFYCVHKECYMNWKSFIWNFGHGFLILIFFNFISWKIQMGSMRGMMKLNNLYLSNFICSHQITHFYSINEIHQTLLLLIQKTKRRPKCWKNFVFSQCVKGRQ